MSRPYVTPSIVAILAALCLLLAACQSDAPPELPVEDILAQAVTRTQNLQSFRFAIDREGAPAFLNEARSLGFSRAEGEFYAPDQAQAAVRVAAPGMLAEVSMIALGDEYWETELLTGNWNKLPTGMGFNPAALFNPQSGFQDILRRDLSNLNYEGVQELDELPGMPLYALSGTLDSTRLYDISFGLIGPEALTARLWIDPQTFDVVRVQIVEPIPPEQVGIDGETATTWLVDFWDFNRGQPISPPPTGSP